MQAVIRTGGKQYRVKEGDHLTVERLHGDAGDEVELRAVMLFDGADLLASGGTVTARVVGDTKGPKLTVFKYKPKTGYRKKRGHRQHQTEIEILSIGQSAPPED